MPFKTPQDQFKPQAYLNFWILSTGYSLDFVSEVHNKILQVCGLMKILWVFSDAPSAISILESSLHAISSFSAAEFGPRA
jgi:hypothetical protein